jgi:hypothetical protein
VTSRSSTTSHLVMSTMSWTPMASSRAWTLRPTTSMSPTMLLPIWTRTRNGHVVQNHWLCLELYCTFLCCLWPDYLSCVNQKSHKQINMSIRPLEARSSMSLFQRIVSWACCSLDKGPKGWNWLAAPLVARGCRGPEPWN